MKSSPSDSDPASRQKKAPESFQSWLQLKVDTPDKSGLITLEPKRYLIEEVQSALLLSPAGSVRLQVMRGISTILMDHRSQLLVLPGARTDLFPQEACNLKIHALVPASDWPFQADSGFGGLVVLNDPVLYELGRMTPFAVPTRVAQATVQKLGFAKQRALRTSAQPDITGILSDEVRQTAATIKANIAASLQIKDLAKQAGLSVSQLHRLFKRDLGTSPGQYQLRFRLAMALRALSTTGDPIAMIARNCHYYDHNHLAKHFVRVLGSSPSEFRD